MKNKFNIIFLSLLTFFSIFFSSYILANEVQFEAENIETLDENTLVAKDNVIVQDGLNIKIYGKKLFFDKKKKIYNTY